MGQIFGKYRKYSISCVLILVLLGYCYFHYQRNHPDTDDAYIQANVVHLAPRLTDTVSQVFIVDQQHVVKGQPLFQLDAEPYRIKLSQAEDKLEAARLKIKSDDGGVKQAQALVLQRQAELNNIQLETSRELILAKQGFVSVQEADNAKKNLSVAIQNLKSAQSQLSQAENIRGATGDNNAEIHQAQLAVDQAKLNLSYTTITAPCDGYIANFTLCPGSKVDAYQEVLALIQDHSYWIEANYKETQLSRMQPGNPATIHVDMYPGVKFSGVVQSISSGSGVSFSLLPPENATGNWIKITQRFPVRIQMTNPDTRYPLRLGASATVVVKTK